MISNDEKMPATNADVPAGDIDEVMKDMLQSAAELSKFLTESGNMHTTMTRLCNGEGQFMWLMALVEKTMPSKTRMAIIMELMRNVPELMADLESCPSLCTVLMSFGDFILANEQPAEKKLALEKSLGFAHAFVDMANGDTDDTLHFFLKKYKCEAQLKEAVRKFIPAKADSTQF